MKYSLLILALLVTGCAGDWTIPAASNQSHQDFLKRNFYATHGKLQSR